MTQHVWKQMRTGVAWDILNPHASNVFLEDVVYAMRDINRYDGNAKVGVDLLFHSLLVEEFAEYEVKPYALLHDVHEIYIGDETKPVNMAMSVLMPGYAEKRKELAHVRDLAIWEAFGVEPPSEEILKELRYCDALALSTERENYLAKSDCPWPDLPAPMDVNKLSFQPGCETNIARFVMKLLESCVWVPPLRPKG